jgi:hypothetical protein
MNRYRHLIPNFAHNADTSAPTACLRPPFPLKAWREPDWVEKPRVLQAIIQRYRCPGRSSSATVGLATLSGVSESSDVAQALTCAWPPWVGALMAWLRKRHYNRRSCVLARGLAAAPISWGSELFPDRHTPHRLRFATVLELSQWSLLLLV